MPKLIPMISVVVMRDGEAKRLNPADKKPFDFTDDEVKDILAADPDGLRKPINEGGEQQPTQEPTKSTGKPKATGDKTGEDM